MNYTDEIMIIHPSVEYKDQIIAALQSFQEKNEIMHGSGSLAKLDSVEEWIDEMEKNRYPETVKAGMVPADTFLGIRKSDNKLVGIINFRHELNDLLFQFGGHIGYSILPEERQKGYGKVMTMLAVEKAREFGLERIMITCEKKNAGSAKIIQGCGGILENEAIRQDGEIVQRYWIKLR